MICVCRCLLVIFFVFFFQAEDGIRDLTVTGVQTCALPIFSFQVRAPQTAGTYSLHVRPVIEGTTWMEDQGVFLAITVPLPAGAVPRLVATVVRSGLAIPWDLAFAP